MALFFGAIAALAATSYAHGTVSGIVADGTYYGGWHLDYYYAIQNGQSYPATPGWYAEDLDNGFIAPDAYTTADIICHKNAKNSNTSATVAAGGAVDFQWTAWPESHIGPVITYVANCGGDCGSVDKSTLKWVKIDAAGYENGQWAAVKMIANNNTWSTTVPSTLAAGKYVFRHEIIALHGAGSQNGAQNYPQCLNIEITGGGSDNPEGTLGTALYTPTDAGILFNPYVSDIQYTIPGPALYGSGSSSGSSKTTAPASSTSKAAATATATSKAATTTAAVASSTATPSLAQNVSPTATSTAKATATSTATPSSGSGVPQTFTIDTFIAWLEEQAGISSSKARRHARQFF